MYDQLQKAFECAALSHQEPRKGSDIPYISHLLAVTALILEVGGTEEEACAGMLHDVLEDTDMAFDSLQQQFGADIAQLVDSVTEQDKSLLWGARKDRYIEQIRCGNESTLIVSAADKLANLRSLVHDYNKLGDDLWARFNADKASQIWFYGTLLDVYKVSDVSPRILPWIEEMQQSLQIFAPRQVEGIIRKVENTKISEEEEYLAENKEPMEQEAKRLLYQFDEVRVELRELYTLQLAQMAIPPDQVDASMEILQMYNLISWLIENGDPEKVHKKLGYIELDGLTPMKAARKVFIEIVSYHNQESDQFILIDEDDLKKLHDQSDEKYIIR
jgi:hypothetical protein